MRREKAHRHPNPTVDQHNTGAVYERIERTIVEDRTLPHDTTPLAPTIQNAEREPNPAELPKPRQHWSD